MTRLGDVLADVKPGFATGDDLDDGVFQFRMHNFTRESALDFTKRRRVGATAKQLELQSVAPGDVLFNATNSPELVGKSALIGELDEPAVFSNHFMRLRTDPTQLDPGYLAHFLRFQFRRGVFRAMAKAWVNQATIGRDRLEGLDIPLPALDEQRRIAAILNQADALRAKRRQALSHLSALTRSIFHQMFDRTTAVVKFGDVITEGPTNGLYRPASDYGSGTPILRIDGFDLGVVKDTPWKRVRIPVSERDRYSLRVGDVIVNRVNALSHLGKSALIERLDEPSVYESNMMRIRLDGEQSSPRFVIAWLQTPSVKQQVLSKAKKAINQASINQEDVRSLLMPLPPRDLQTTFARRVERVEAHRVAVQGALAAEDELFASLQSRAFRGEL